MPLTTQPSLDASFTPRRDNTILLIGIAVTVVLVHLVTNHRYGFHRDELQVLSDALHLDWGFVAYPPWTPLVERVSLEIFGPSLASLRLFSTVAQALAVMVTGFMALEVGGGRLAQITAALAIALSPLPMFEATEFQYTSFDYLWWVLIAYFLIRLLKTEDERWWMAIGAAAGAGLMTKYTMCFLLSGVLGGLLLTPARRFLRSVWFWVGVALALLIVLPNFMWQVRHGFVSLHFLQHIHARDVRRGQAEGFVFNQFRICVNLFAAPLWIAGLVGFFRDRRYRMLAWMYVIPLGLFLVAKGRFYYLGAAYPMLVAKGATAAERWVAFRSRGWRWVVKGAFFTGLAGCGLYFAALIIPFAPGGRLRAFALKNNGDLREEIGWNELVKTVADIRDSLPPEEQKGVGVVVGNYGEQGAIEILGPAYHLPPPISGTNSAWLRGYPTPPPSSLIVLGLAQKYVDDTFTACRLAGRNGNRDGVENEESREHPDIFVCRGPRLPWPEFWKEYQSFG